MNISDHCTTLVSAWEGLPDGDPSTLNYDPYLDPVNIWTVGYGRALRDPATGKYLVGMKDRKKAYGLYPGGVTKATARTMLDDDLREEAGRVEPLTRPGASQAEFDALVSLNFNIGAFSTSTLRKLHVNAVAPGGLPSDQEIRALRDRVRDKTLGTPKTVREAFAAWSFGKGVFFGGLFCRRLAEFALYRGASGAQANAFGERVRAVIAA